MSEKDETEEVEETKSEEEKGQSTTESEEDNSTESEGDDEDNLVELPSGDKVTVSELMSGYMKDSDYRKKTADLAVQRKALEKPEKEETKGKDEDPLKKYKPEDLAVLKDVMKAMGVVSKDELEERELKMAQSTATATFFTNHPEYTEDKDPTGERYGALRAELTYYNLNDPKTLPKILEKAHKDVEARYEKTTKKAKELANKTRVKDASVGSGGSGGIGKETDEDTKKYSEAQIEMMKTMGVFEKDE